MLIRYTRVLSGCSFGVTLMNLLSQECILGGRNWFYLAQEVPVLHDMIVLYGIHHLAMSNTHDYQIVYILCQAELT